MKAKGCVLVLFVVAALMANALAASCSDFSPKGIFEGNKEDCLKFNGGGTCYYDLKSGGSINECMLCSDHIKSCSDYNYPDACTQDGCRKGCKWDAEKKCVPCSGISCDDGASTLTDYFDAQCTCPAMGTTICASGRVSRWGAGNTAADAAVACKARCAETSAGYADCSGQGATCNDCCNGYCAAFQNQEAECAQLCNNKEKCLATCKLKDKCTTSCKNSCASRKTTWDLINTIFMAAGILGAAMIIVHAIRITLSSDSEGRDEAKKSLIHVIIALIIMSVVVLIVMSFMDITGVTLPQTCTLG